MATNYNRRYGYNSVRANDVFDSDIDKLRSKDVGLYPKLTILFKRGFGLRYVPEPEELDAPTKKKHSEYIQTQFAKATYDHYVRATTVEVDRLKTFEDFIAMDYTPEISSALDIYADESLTKSETGEILKVECDNSRVKKVLENLFNDILDIDHNLWYWTRNMCKFGNHYILLDVQPDKGVCGFLPLPVKEIRREEAYDGNINSVKFMWDHQNLEFDSWQIAHFRLLDKMDKYPYGTAVIESSRLIWKQLTLAEDAMLIYRVTRAPERRVFYIDVGNIDPKDVPNYIKTIKDQIKRTPVVDQTTGNVDKKYNTMAIDEDFFIPRRNDKNSEVDSLPGASNLDEIADIEYLQNKLFASLKVPKAYLTFDEQINAKATLASEDFRFARTINRVQQSLITTLINIAITHLWSIGFRDKEHITGFDIELTNPSTQTDLEKIEIYSEKANVFSTMWNESTLSPVSYVWAMENIFGFSEDEIRLIIKQQHLEGKIKLEIEKASGGGQEEGMGMQAGFEGGEQPAAGGGSSFQDQGGNELPSTPPEGQEYVDAETGEVVESLIRTLGELRDKQKSVSKSMIDKQKRMIVNSLSYDGTVRMLQTLDENLKLKQGTYDIKFGNGHSNN